MNEYQHQPVASFSKAAKSLLGYYVYRLVDPRNGQTFYVGKGKNDRVFQHMQGISPKDWKDRSKDEEITEENAKIARINEIIGEKLQVLCFIHRHDMDEDTAYEVEGALIDAYGSLTNIQTGHDNRTRGCMCIEQIERKAESKQADFGNDKFVVIKIRPRTLAEVKDIYTAVRGNWVLSPSRAQKHPVLACVDGIIVGAFNVTSWDLISQDLPQKRQRYRFTGTQSTKLSQRFSEAIIPSKYRRKGQANPILYINC